jgi:hypothetical protein
MRMCTDRKGVKDLPILAQGLPAVLWAGSPASGGLIRRFYGGLFSVKVAAVKRNINQSLAVMLKKPVISYHPWHLITFLSKA